MCMVISFRTYVIWVFRLLLSLTCQNQERNRNKYQLVEMSKGYSMLPQKRTISTIPWSAKKPDRIYFFSDEIVVTKINSKLDNFHALVFCCVVVFHSSFFQKIDRWEIYYLIECRKIDMIYANAYTQSALFRI